MCASRYAGTLLNGGAVEFEVENGIIVSVTPIKDSPALPWIMPVLAGFLLRNVGYTTLYLYAAFFMALAFVTMRFVRHGDTKFKAQTGLEAFEDL